MRLFLKSRPIVHSHVDSGYFIGSGKTGSTERICYLQKTWSQKVHSVYY